MRKRLKKSFIAIVGSLVLVAGIVMIPYPGPGWLVVFAGLGILAQEFVWAQRVLGYAKGKYDAWTQWVASRGRGTRISLWVATAAVVIVTIWLVNGYGLINGWLGLGQDWVRSPLFGN